MRDKPGVLILTPFYEPNIGGVETHLKDLTDYLRRDGNYKIYVLTYQPITTKSKGRYLEKNGDVTIIRIPWVGLNIFHKLEPYPVLEFLYITPWLFLCCFIFLLLKGKKIQVIHAQGFNASFITRCLIKIFKKKFIASTHSIYEIDPNSLMAKMAKWTLRVADKVFALSAASKKELVKIGLKEDNVEIYRYWVNQKVFKPFDKVKAKKKVGWEKKFIVLFVGRFIKIKGMHVLLEVAKQTTKDINFAFIGDGPLSKVIYKSSIELPNVIFVGKIDNRELPLYFNAAEILCVPSQYEEGFGRVIIEALSCGTPVVGSNKGGIPEAIDNTVGMSIKPNVGNLKCAIEFLNNNREELMKLSWNCRKFAEKKFSEKNALRIRRSYG